MIVVSGERPASTQPRRRPFGRTLAALAAVVVLLASCATPGPGTPAPSTGPGTQPGASTAAGSLDPGASEPGASGPGAPGPGTSEPGASDEPATGPTPTPPPESAWSAVQPTVVQAVATFEPTRTVAAGVPVDAGFRLASLTGEDAVTLARGLTATPAVTLKVAGQADGSALITPTHPLYGGTLYRFALAASDGTVRATWPVETVGGLWITTMVPDDQTTDVPVTTGIEFTFSVDGVSPADLERFLTIQPATSGHLKQDGRTIAFVPNTPLKQGTRYRVMVAKGLPLAGTQEVLGERQDISFTTAGAVHAPVHVSLQGTLVESPTGDRPVLSVYLDRQTDDDNKPTVKVPKAVPVTVHRLPDLPTAIAGWRAISQDWWDTSSNLAPVETAGLPLVADAALPVHRFGPAYPDDEDGGGARRWVRLPERLAAGWYVVTASLPGSAAQAVLQVTDVAVYVTTTRTSSVVWANDIATGGPLAGAEVTFGDAALGRTGADGILKAVISAPATDGEPTVAPVLVVRDGDRAAFTPTSDSACGKCEHGGSGDPGNAWWQLVELDRTLLRQADTVTGWGVVRVRETGKVPAAVTLQLTTWSDEAGEPLPIAETSVKPDESGAYPIRLPLVNVPDGWYDVRVLVNGTTVTTRSFQVGEILKPAWSLEISAAKHAVVLGSSVKVTAHASFYDGTPVAGTRIKAGVTGPFRKATTDVAGKATLKVPVRHHIDDDGSGPWWVTSIDAVPVEPEEAQIQGSTMIAVFTSGVLPDVQATGTATRLKVTGTVHNVAWDRFESGSVSDLEMVDPYGSPASGRKVVVKLAQHTWTTKRIGSTYNFISKQTEPVYETTEHVRNASKRTLRTDASGGFALSIPISGATSGYEVTVTAYDSRGRSTTVETWGEVPNTTTADTPVPHLVGPTTSTGPEMEPEPEPQSLGEKATVSFEGIKDTSGSRYLWLVARDGLQDTVITSRPRVELVFDERWIPTAWVTAARFTGSGYEVPSNEAVLPFATEDRRLTVTLGTDKTRYAPGDQVTVSVRVRNAAGKGVAASVHLRGVDEKLFAIGAADVEDPIGQLYTDSGSGITGSGWTHRVPRPVFGTDGGDTMGGDDEPRTDFRDWLVSTVVRTDTSGRASITFRVSDDLTTWRIVGQAVTEDIGAGTGIVRIPVSIPFFAETTVAPTYLATDRPIISARGYGGGMSETSTVRFTFSSDSLRMAPITRTARAFRPAEVALPALTPGKHTIRIEARSGDGADAQRDILVRTFEVIGPRAVQATVASTALTGATRVPAGEGATVLTFADGGRGRVVPLLQQIAESSPSRSDVAAANRLARQVLKDTFGIESGGTEPALSMFVREEGIALVPWGAAVLETTALAALAGAGEATGAQVFSTNEEPRAREQSVWALVGQAASGGTVLNELRAIARTSGLSVQERTALAIALVAVGDEDGARSIEQQLVHEQGRRYGPWVRISGGGAEGDALLTARVAIVAAWLGDPLAEAMDAYVAANPPTGTLIVLERALAAAGWAKRMPPSTATAAVTVDGVRREMPITAGRPATVSLTPAQAATATVEPVSGTVLMTTRTQDRVGSAQLIPVDGLAITRSVKPSSPLGAADQVRVTLTVTMPAQLNGDCWNVTETVPSGMRPLVVPPRVAEDGDTEANDELVQSGIVREPSTVDGQRITWCVARELVNQTTARITYLARIITPGTYTWEPAIVQSAIAPDHGTILPATTITIAGLTGG